MINQGFSWISLFLSIVCTTSGQLIYKRFSQNKRLLLFLLSIALFGLAQLANYFALRTLDVGITYMFMGSTHILIFFLSSYYFNEKITRKKIVSVLLIISGIVLYGFGTLY